MLVNMVFGLPFLEFSKLQHVELFAGQCAVTRSELKDALAFPKKHFGRFECLWRSKMLSHNPKKDQGT